MESPASPPGGPDGFVVSRGHQPVPAWLRGGVVGIGNFDGVHGGHRFLIGTVRSLAAETGAPAIVLTFEPHPRLFFAPDAPMFRLTPEPVKLKVLSRLGLDAAFVWPFDAGLAAMSAADFIGRLIVGEIGASALVVGEDFHFGQGRRGTPDMLRRLCAAHGIGCVTLEQASAGGEIISSSAIRRLLEAGEIGHGNALLGYRWFVEGVVRHGDKRGRDLGFPTANLDLGPHCRLRHGIYAVRVALGPGDIRDAVASYGRRPTFDDGAPLLEVFVFDFVGDLYGRTIEVEFVGWIRGEERFDSAAALMSRMHEDASEARAVLGAAATDGPRSMIG